MSKIETVKALNDSEPQLAIVRKISELQQSIVDLPDLIRNELEQTRLPEEIRAALTPLDEMTRALEAQQTAVGISVETAAKSLQDAAAILVQVKRSMAQIESQAVGPKGLVPALSSASTQTVSLISQATDKIIRESEKSRNSWLRQWTMIVLGGLAAALVVLGGQSVLDDLRTVRLNKDLAGKAQTLEVLWSKASPKEQEQISRILRR